MNEQYAKHLIENNKNETPMQLWMQFVGMQIAFGAALVIIVGLLSWLAS